MGERFQLVERGRILYLGATIDGESVKVWPVAATYADAARLARWFEVPGASVARIGSVEGESFEAIAEASKGFGCVAWGLVVGWDDDGKPRMEHHWFGGNDERTIAGDSTGDA
jgi:hypothetical protein